MYDAVVVFGAGFKGPETAELDGWGKARLDRAIQAVKNGEAKNILITGLLRHPYMQTQFCRECNGLAFDAGISPGRIFGLRGGTYFPVSTEGDIRQINLFAESEHWSSLLIVTERPHWLFRVRWLCRKNLHPRIELAFAPSMPAPWWYWLKECIGGIFLRTVGLESSLYRFSRYQWKKFSPFFGAYAPDIDQNEVPRR